MHKKTRLSQIQKGNEGKPRGGIQGEQLDSTPQVNTNNKQFI